MSKVSIIPLLLILSSHLQMAGASDVVIIEKDGWTLRLTADGAVRSLRSADGREMVDPGCGTGHLRLGTARADQVPSDWLSQTPEMMICDRPTEVRKIEGGCAFSYDLSADTGLRVAQELRLVGVKGGIGIERSVTLIPTAMPFRRDVLLTADCNLTPGGEGVTVFVPRQDGIGESLLLPVGGIWTWPFHCPARPIAGPAEHLAIPLLSSWAGESGPCVTRCADPFWDVHLRPALPAAGQPGFFACLVQASRVPLNEPLTRRFWTIVHRGRAEEALAAWYATALGEVPPGPGWLHDIAWQHYDYLSHGGKGWFEDIDALEKHVAPADRGRIIVTLHGWYGLLGKYAFDEESGRLLDQWMAMPNAAAMKGQGFPTSESVPMTIAEVHRRIRYARERGLRVALYFADGLAACEGAGLYREEELLSWGGWQGPDTIGRTYVQNPAHPRVYQRYLNYLKALLAEYGREIDALVWDETFMVRTGMITPPHSPAQAWVPGVFMRLVRDLTQTTTLYNRELAFLSSDCIGVSFDGRNFWTDIPPYAIVSHGCYQDSHSNPVTWPYGIFPNYRNVLWSCNWQAVTRFDYTEFGVRHYDTPVATSNGWLDDKGLARLSDEERRAVLTLFEERKKRSQRLRFLTGPPPVFVPGSRQ